MKPKIPTWTYQDITNKEFAWQQAELVESLQGKVRMQLSDGDIIVGIRMALINLFFMQVLLKFDIPISKRHYIKRRAFNGETTAGAWNRYYEEIVRPNPRVAKRFKLAVWDAMQDLYTFTSTYLLPWTCSIDGVDIAEIVTDPKMAEIIATKEKLKPELGTDIIEKQIDEGAKQMMKYLGTPGALQNEALLPFQRVAQLNKFQVPQTLLAFGVRTDINDNIIGYPVIGAVVDGLRNVQEYACESLSAKKSQFYSQVAVPSSQYFGRKLHLIASALEHIYDRDCESTALVDFDVTEQNYENLVGKNIVHDGKFVTLTKNNVRDFINTTIHMRSPMTCRYRTGICSTCGGKIFDNISRKINIGILGSIQVIEPTTQKILSAKHLIKTNTILYEVPPQTNKILVRANSTDVRWRPELYPNLDTIEMGIYYKYFSNIHDVRRLRRDRPIREEKLSKVYEFFLRNTKTPEKEPIRVQLESNGQVPFLTSEFLLHIKENYDNLKFEDPVVWIPMKDTARIPLFRNIVINDNMRDFVKSVERFLSKDVKSYRSCSDALEGFSRTIYDKVSANITHLEILLRAYMITSPSDYRIPMVEDPNDVHFQTTSSILNNRNIGTKLAYEGLAQYICQPSTYLVSRQGSPFDWMTVI